MPCRGEYCCAVNGMRKGALGSEREAKSYGPRHGGFGETDRGEKAAQAAERSAEALYSSTNAAIKNVLEEENLRVKEQEILRNMELQNVGYPARQKSTLNSSSERS